MALMLIKLNLPLSFTRAYELIELFFNSMGAFILSLSPIGIPLVVLNTELIISFYLWCMLGGSV